MMKQLLYIAAGAGFFIAACTGKGKTGAADSPFIGNKLNTAWLAQVTGNSDTSYSKPYLRRDFVTAWYYVHNADSSICQVMKDSAGEVRQVMIEKKNIRTFFCQFYPNGQPVDRVALDSEGKPHGKVEQFYPDGTLQAKGRYTNGMATGEWEYFDEQGKPEGKQRFSEDGQLMKDSAE